MMTDKSGKLPDTAAIEAEAAAWVARFDAGDVPAKDRAAFQAWLNHSALHRVAIAEYDKLWAKLDALRRLTDTGEAGPLELAALGLFPILKTGKAKAIRFSTLAAICEALDCQPGDVLAFENDDKKAKQRA